MLLPMAVFVAAATFGNGVDPATTTFPWKNGPARDAVYRLAEHPNVVHVLEAWTLTCGGCGDNAASVSALAEEYAGEPRVVFLDMGLDPAERDYTRWIAAHAPNHPVVQDVDRVIFDGLRRVDTVPQAFILDCNGHLAGWVSGHWGDEVKETVRAAVHKALAVTCDE